MSNTFCVTITESKSNGDKATLGFVVANAALGSDKDTMVFLSADGVWAAVKGEVDQIDEGEPFAPLKDLVEKFVKNGGKILVCSPCMKKRGITEASLVDGASPAGGAALVEWLANGSPSVGY
ncbi:MAG: DsrE family protein [Candidatus Krumholzibacteriia bacterium]